jgi:hypothetical protein
MDRNKTTGIKILNCRNETLRSVAGCRRKDQITNTNIMEELNIFNLNARVKIRIIMEISRATNGKQGDSEGNSKTTNEEKEIWDAHI